MGNGVATVSVDVFPKAVSHCLSEVAFGRNVVRMEVQPHLEAFRRESVASQPAQVFADQVRFSPPAVNILLRVPERPKSLPQHSATE